MPKAKVLQSFTLKGKRLMIGEEVTLSKEAADLYGGIDFIEVVKEQPAPPSPPVKKAATKGAKRK